MKLPTKQQAIQITIAALSAVGGIAALGPEVNLLPQKLQPWGVALVMGSIIAEKILIAANQLLVGPSAIQNAPTQVALAKLPDLSTPAIDTSKNLTSVTPPESISK
jgi:hypothetical protein